MTSTAGVIPIILFALLAGTAAASSIQLTLTLDPAETLPGLPVSFRVQAVNTSSSPARIPRWVVLEVTPKNGQPFLTVAGIPRRVQRAAEFDGGGETMAAGETRRLDWWARPESPPWWAGPFWLEPGVYSLRLIADDRLEDYGSDQYSPEGLADPIVSSSAALTIAEPTGVDSKVWQMAKLKQSWDWIYSSANEIWERYPESTYAGYTLPHSTDTRNLDVTLQAVERLLRERTVQKRPHGAYLDWWRLEAIQIHERTMHRVVENDPNIAYQHAQAMRRHSDAILASDGDPLLKKRAEDWKQATPTLAQLEEYSRNLRNIYAPLQKISPIVECVTPGLNGSFTARFGYDNPNAYVVRLLAGPANKFSPPPEDREQETHFLPGRHRNVFTVTHSGGNLVWTLHAQTVTASMRHTPPCRGNRDLPPTKGCLDTEPTAMRARSTTSRDSGEATAMSFTARVMPILFCALLAGTAAASSIQLTLTLDPAETLPGLPVSFRVQAVNTSSAPARIPRWAVLEVTPKNGQPFLTVAGMPRSMQRAAELRDGGETMSAGETRRLDWWAGPESPPWWGGPFWLEPGVYSLRLIADEGLKNYGSDQYNAAGLADPILSNSTVLTIQQPAGADAAVWQMAKARPHWNWIHNSAEEIWTRYPESTYAGYTLPQSRDGKRDVTLAAIERLLKERTGENKPHGAYLERLLHRALRL